MKSVTSNGNLSAGEGNDEGKLLLKAIEELLSTEVKLYTVVDSTDLFLTLSTFRLTTDRSIRGNTRFIRFEFAAKRVSSMIWVHRKINLADTGAKPSIRLTHTLQVLHEFGCLLINFS